MSSLGLDQRLALLSPDLTLNPLQWNRISGSELGAEKKCILPRTRGWEINPIWPRSDLDKMVISELVASECEWHFSIFSPRLRIKGKPRASVERTNTNVHVWVWHYRSVSHRGRKSRAQCTCLQCQVLIPEPGTRDRFVSGGVSCL